MRGYLVHFTSDEVVQFTKDEIIFDKAWIEERWSCKGVEANHARITVEDGVCFMAPVGGTVYVNNVQIKEPKTKLYHDDLIMLGLPDPGNDAIFVFKDAAQRQKLLDSQKIRMHSFSRSTSEKVVQDFFSRCNTTSLKTFAAFVLDFMVRVFRIQRGVLYRLEGTRCIPIASRALALHYDPPRSILDRVWETKLPERFSVPEVMDPEELTMSIQRNKVYSAICFPMVYNGKIEALLYVDTQEEECQLNQDDLVIMCTLMPAVGGILRTLLHYDQILTECVKLVGGLCLQDYTPKVEWFRENVGFHQGFTFSRYQGGADYAFYIKITPRKGAFTVHKFVAFYTQLLTMLRFSRFEFGAEEEGLQHVYDTITRDNPFLKYEMAIVAIKDGELRFSGNGGVLSVKRPDEYKRDAFMLDASRVDDVSILLIQECEPESRFILSASSGEFCCGLLNRTTDNDAIAAQLRKGCGGLLGMLLRCDNEEESPS